MPHPLSIEQVITWAWHAVHHVAPPPPPPAKINIPFLIVFLLVGGGPLHRVF